MSRTRLESDRSILQAVDIEWTSMYWGGLEYNNKWSLLDGTAGHSDWYYAIGAISFWEGGIPGKSKPVEIVELYVASQSKYTIWHGII